MSKLVSWCVCLALSVLLLGSVLCVRPSRHARRLDTSSPSPPIVTPFDRNHFDDRHFLTAYPSDTLLSQSYPIRETLTSLQGRSMPERQMAYTEAELHLADSKQSNGLIQFRQVVSCILFPYPTARWSPFAWSYQLI